MADMIEVVLDNGNNSSDYVYKKQDETDEDYKIRLDKLYTKLLSQASVEEKRLAGIL